ncbi:unnamed protein product [Laminaria digitata]
MTTVDNIEHGLDSTMVVETPSAGKGKVDVTAVFRRPVISTSWSAAGGNPVLVASLIRYSRKE